MATYADFSNVNVEKRYATIGDREFDVTTPPLSIILFLNRKTAVRKKEGLSVLYEDYWEALYMWLHALDSEITHKWMDDNISSTQFQQIMYSVFLDITAVPLVKFEPKVAKKVENETTV